MVAGVHDFARRSPDVLSIGSWAVVLRRREHSEVSERPVT
jgi:hypothetical protein